MPCTPILAFSALVTVAAYLIMLRAYHSEGGHYLLHGICWCSLFLPQLVPILRYGLAIFHPTWALILASTATGGILFQDMVLVPRVSALRKEAAEFVYNELRFYLDKMFVGVLTLGTGVAAMMTILWTAPEHAFDMIRPQGEFWAVYSLVCFVAVGRHAGRVMSEKVDQQAVKIQALLPGPQCGLCVRFSDGYKAPAPVFCRWPAPL